MLKPFSGPRWDRGSGHSFGRWIWESHETQGAPGPRWLFGPPPPGRSSLCTLQRGRWKAACQVVFRSRFLLVTLCQPHFLTKPAGRRGWQMSRNYRQRSRSLVSDIKPKGLKRRPWFVWLRPATLLLFTSCFQLQKIHRLEVSAVPRWMPDLGENGVSARRNSGMGNTEGKPSPVG